MAQGKKTDKPAILALADGTVFRGIGFGALKAKDEPTIGEVVFNTSMYGYQEILTDPSYAGQIMSFTYPHIGNVGCNHEDVESDQVFAEGLVVRDLSRAVSSFRSEQTLSQYLKQNDKMGISGVDTRAGWNRILPDQIFGGNERSEIARLWAHIAVRQLERRSCKCIRELLRIFHKST